MKSLLLSLLAFVALPAAAGEFVWANLTGTATDLAWTSAANWINADGTPATTYPKSAADTAVFRGCSAGRIAPSWGSTIGTVRVESGYTMWNNSTVSIDAFSCAPHASLSYQYGGDSNPNPWFKFSGLTEADNVDGFYPNITGMQNNQHKVFSRVSGNAGSVVWAGKAPGYAAYPTNRTDMLFNNNAWPYSFTVPTNAHYGVVCWNSQYGNVTFADDVALEIGSGLFLGGGNDWKWNTIGEPGSAGTKPQGTIRVPGGHALWFWGDKHWILRSRVDASAIVVTRRQKIVLAGDRSGDTCDYRVVCGTLQLGGDLSVTSSDCRSDWFNAHPTGVECAGGTGDYVVEWAGTLVVGCANAVSKTSTIELPGVYDRPTDATLHGKIQLNASTRCAALVVDGRKMPAGTYGSTSSAADNQDDGLFAGTGVLTVPGTGTFIVVQ